MPNSLHFLAGEFSIMASANWQKGDLIIREEVVFANGRTIRLADIVLATADKSNRPTAASNRAFLVMAGSAVLAAALIAFVPPAIVYASGTISNGSRWSENEAQSSGGVIMLISALVFIAEWATSNAATRPRKRTRKDICAKCGYSLIGNVSGTCPECGTMITADKL
jgi:hypothetical protein